MPNAANDTPMSLAANMDQLGPLSYHAASAKRQRAERPSRKNCATLKSGTTLEMVTKSANNANNVNNAKNAEEIITLSPKSSIQFERRCKPWTETIII